MAIKTHEEIEALKENWKNDPCWDIENTDGFEEHHDELLAFRQEWTAEKERQHQHRLKDRVDKVALETGVKDAWIAKDLWTFSEIESRVQGMIRRIDEEHVFAMGMQVRATLLLAAQMKRIADALESMESDSTTEFMTRLYNIE